MNHRAVLFINGELRSSAGICRLLQPDDYLIAVDGGLNHLTRLGIPPNLIIGDLDSANPQEVLRARENGIEVQQYPSEKDETDLELAITIVLERGYHHLLLVAGLGGRLDQTLANLSLLSLPQLVDCTVRMDDGAEEVFLIRHQAEIYGRPGDIVSLLAWQEPAHGVITRELAYPLHAETLYPERTRGISNCMTTEHAQVSLQSGCLLCIHTRKE